MWRISLGMFPLGCLHLQGGDRGQVLLPGCKAGEAGSYFLYTRVSLMGEKRFHSAKHLLVLNFAVSPPGESVKGLRMLIQ